MPYIKQAERPALDPLVEAMGRAIVTPGQFAYVVYAWFKRHVSRNFFSFALYVGALVLVLLEIYRRIIAGYEDEKIAAPENGDVE